MITMFLPPSDPYVLISQAGEALYRCHEKKKTVNPVWNDQTNLCIEDVFTPLVYEVQTSFIILNVFDMASTPYSHTRKPSAKDRPRQTSLTSVSSMWCWLPGVRSRRGGQRRLHGPGGVRPHQPRAGHLHGGQPPPRPRGRRGPYQVSNI